MMDNAMFKANMKNTENDICNMPTLEPGISKKKWYALRKKYVECIATVLKAKED